MKAVRVPKIEAEFSFEYSEIQAGLTKVIFSRKDSDANTNFNDTACGGGSCSN